MSTISGGMLCSCCRKVRMPFRMSPQLKQSSNPFLSSFALQRGRALTFVHSARASRVALGRSFKTLYLYLPRPMHSTAARRFCHAAGSGAVLLSDSSDESVSQSSSSSQVHTTDTCSRDTERASTKAVSSAEKRSLSSMLHTTWYDGNSKYGLFDSVKKPSPTL